MINEFGYVCDYCGDDKGEFLNATGNHPVCEENAALKNQNSHLQSTISQQSELIRELKTDSTYWYKKYMLVPGVRENMTMFLDASSGNHLMLMAKIDKMEGENEA